MTFELGIVRRDFNLTEFLVVPGSSEESVEGITYFLLDQGLRAVPARASRVGVSLSIG